MVKQEQIRDRVNQIHNTPQCLKINYLSKKAAKVAMKEINHHSAKKIQYSYWCYSCNAYHLTSRNKVGDRNFKRMKIKKGIRNAT